MKPRLSDQIYNYLRSKQRAVTARELATEFGTSTTTINHSIERLNNNDKVKITKRKFKGSYRYKLVSNLPLEEIRETPFTHKVYNEMVGNGRLTLRQIATRLGDEKMPRGKLLSAFNGLNVWDGVNVKRFQRGKESEYLLEVNSKEKLKTVEDIAKIKPKVSTNAVNLIFSNRSSELFQKSL